jgi:hypothetical protein
MLLVYIKQEHYMNVSDVESDFIATGLHGIMVSQGDRNMQCSLNGGWYYYISMYIVLKIHVMYSKGAW